MSYKEITLTVPLKSEHIFDWLKNKSPEEIADIILLSKSAYGLLQRNVISGNFSNEFEEKMNEIVNKNKNDIINIEKKNAYAIDNLKKEHNEKLSRIQNDNDMTINKINQLYERQTNSLVAENTSLKEQHNKIENEVSSRCNHQIDYYLKNNKELLNTIDAKEHIISNLRNEFDKKSDDYFTRFENINKLLTGTASNKGIVGENFVQDIFSNMRLGYLDDTRYSDNTGSEDFVWRWTPSNETANSNSYEMTCSVEIKNSERLHSVNDINKHQTRITEARNANKINCGLFLSLRCRIQNTNPIEIKYVSGIPVLYVSKTSNITSSNVVEIGFSLMSIFWQYSNFTNINNSTSDGDSNTILKNLSSKLSSTIVSQFESLSSLNSQIDDIENSANCLLRQSQKLRKLRIKMISDITSLHSTFPDLLSPSSLLPPADTVSNDSPLLSINSIIAEANSKNIIKALVLFNISRKKYPKSFIQLKSFFDNEEQFTFANSLSEHLKTIIQHVKKNKKQIVDEFGTEVSS